VGRFRSTLGFVTESLIFPWSINHIAALERQNTLNLDEIQNGYVRLSERLARLKEGL
jgi:hypothetical protein